jgi:hypothetical protein
MLRAESAAMHARRIGLVLALALTVVTVARSGHELPVYPSYYPHEIEIQTVAPERAGALLPAGRLHAYIGSEPRFSGPMSDVVRAIESLGSFVVVRINPSSPRAQDESWACAVAGVILRAIAPREGLTVHPYPVTPWHGDYLQHVDRAEAARARLLDGVASSAPALVDLKVKADRRLGSAIRSNWNAQGADWDAEIAEVGVADLLAPHVVALNGWQGPAWIRAGWFHAHLLLPEAANDAAAASRLQSDLRRLQADAFASPLDRINLERDFVAALTSGCRSIVAGYRVKREYFNAEFSAGIENIAFDALDGLHSPMFIRTVKLKDFPWNGWLSLGIDGRAEAAWNPIAGFTDRFGRLMWFAVGDPAALASPYDSTWMPNRISDVETSAKR